MNNAAWFIGASLLFTISVNVNGQVPQKKRKAPCSDHAYNLRSKRHPVVNPDYYEKFEEAVNKGPGWVTEFVKTKNITNLDDYTFLTDIINDWDDPAWIKVVRELLKAGASINARDAKGRTPLMLALIRAPEVSIENINELVAKGADVTLMDKENRTVLSYAVEDGRIEIVEFLFEKLEAQLKEIHSLIYHWEMAPEDLIKIEISPFIGVPHVNKANVNGFTPLMRAANRGNFEVVRFLLEKGANVFAQADGKAADGTDLTALRYANNAKKCFLTHNTCPCKSTGQYCQRCIDRLAQYDNVIFLLEKTMHEEVQS
ncbi:MAG: ankyrin repeat domain-containing protein [Candidatus Babeliales bacterium]|jgi:ankyrin repeat protein